MICGDMICVHDVVHTISDATSRGLSGPCRPPGRAHPPADRLRTPGWRRPWHGVHLHAGDELLRIVSGELAVRVGDQQQRCRAGDIAIIPPNTWHGFHALSDTVIEVVAEQAIGTFFPVRRPDGTWVIVEIYRQDMPWTAPPPAPGRWTTDEEMHAILAAVDIEVERPGTR